LFLGVFQWASAVGMGEIFLFLNRSAGFTTGKGGVRSVFGHTSLTGL